MHRGLRIGLSLLASGIFLFSMYYIIVAFVHPSGTSMATLVVVLVTPGFILTLLGVTSTLYAAGPRIRGLVSVSIGALICVIVLLVILTQVAWFDIAVILSLMSIIFATSLFIIPGIISLRYERFPAPISIICVWIASTIMCTLIELLWLATQAPDFRTSFYVAFLPLLGLGIFLGLLTTGLAHWYYWILSSRHW